MPKIRDRKFTHTDRRWVRLRNDRKHSWKHHFRGAVAQVIGYLELLAKKDPFKEFFVYAQVDDIVKHCNRFGGKGYSKAAVKLALEYLRELWIVSDIVERPRLNKAGELQMFSGRIITPHYAMCETSGPFCKFAPGKLVRGHKWVGTKQKLAAGPATGKPVIWYGGPVEKRP